MNTLGTIAVIFAAAGLITGALGLWLGLSAPLFKSARKVPEAKHRWSITAKAEGTGGYFGDSKTKIVVFIHTRKWDARYPSSTADEREVIGSAEPTDEDRISELLAKAEKRRDEIEAGERYASDAAASINGR